MTSQLGNRGGGGLGGGGGGGGHGVERGARGGEGGGEGGAAAVKLAVSTKSISMVEPSFRYSACSLVEMANSLVDEAMRVRFPSVVASPDKESG